MTGGLGRWPSLCLGPIPSLAILKQDDGDNKRCLTCVSPRGGKYYLQAKEVFSFIRSPRLARKIGDTIDRSAVNGGVHLVQALQPQGLAPPNRSRGPGAFTRAQYPGIRHRQRATSPVVANTTAFVTFPYGPAPPFILPGVTATAAYGRPLKRSFIIRFPPHRSFCDRQYPGLGPCRMVPSSPCGESVPFTDRHIDFYQPCHRTSSS
ncbi:hypothetical protein ACOMHN_057999 [Nucella lapillus]